jgi:hypothetical protein
MGGTIGDSPPRAGHSELGVTNPTESDAFGPRRT